MLVMQEKQLPQNRPIKEVDEPEKRRAVLNSSEKTKTAVARTLQSATENSGRRYVIPEQSFARVVRIALDDVSPDDIKISSDAIQAIQKYVETNMIDFLNKSRFAMGTRKTLTMKIMKDTSAIMDASRMTESEETGESYLDAVKSIGGRVSKGATRRDFHGRVFPAASLRNLALTANIKRLSDTDSDSALDYIDQKMYGLILNVVTSTAMFVNTKKHKRDGTVVTVGRVIKEKHVSTALGRVGVLGTHGN